MSREQFKRRDSVLSRGVRKMLFRRHKTSSSASRYLSSKEALFSRTGSSRIFPSTSKRYISMNPAKLESALRALYQSGLLCKQLMDEFLCEETKLWEQAMQAAKECLEPKEEEHLEISKEAMAFIRGAKWWEFKRPNGGTMWQSDQRICDEEAMRRYPCADDESNGR